jgi:hypothetical protein
MTHAPNNDAAPLAGGASVTDNRRESDLTLAAIRLAPPAHRNAPPGTSEVAAARIMPVAGTMRRRVYEAIIARGEDGLADFEGEARTGIRSQTYTPRRGELARLGLIANSGRKRPTPSNRPAAVWVAIEHTTEMGTP